MEYNIISEHIKDHICSEYDLLLNDSTAHYHPQKQIIKNFIIRHPCPGSVSVFLGGFFKMHTGKVFMSASEMGNRKLF